MNQITPSLAETNFDVKEVELEKKVSFWAKIAQLAVGLLQVTVGLFSKK